jgi:hypothetical protein
VACKCRSFPSIVQAFSGILHGEEQVRVEAFITLSSVKAFDEAILHRFAGPDNRAALYLFGISTLDARKRKRAAAGVFQLGFRFGLRAAKGMEKFVGWIPH